MSNEYKEAGAAVKKAAKSLFRAIAVTVDAILKPR